VNFDFSDEQKDLRDQVRRFLDDKCPSSRVRAAMEADEALDAPLYSGLAELGVLGLAIPESWGGMGLSMFDLCLAAEEIGRAVAPVPVSSSIYLAAELLLRVGSEAQKAAWLPRLVAGSAVGTLAVTEGPGRLCPAGVRAIEQGGRLSGTKVAVPDGMAADMAIVAARNGNADGALSLYLVDLAASGVRREAVSTIDPSRKAANLVLDDAPAELLGPAGDGWQAIEAVLDRAAVLVAFEQLGGAARALEMARNYAVERMAFGRPIGSFQAIKHMLADMYCALELARSNAYFAAWALANEAPELTAAAAVARVAATQAFQLCARNNNQVHGGMGFTWEMDCHLYYRRSNALAVLLGPQSAWEDRLVDSLREPAAATA
jgi:acyl-CoA dehydrogenase